MSSEVQTSNLDHITNDIGNMLQDSFQHINGSYFDDPKNNDEIAEADKAVADDSALDSVVLLDVDKLSLDDEANWLCKTNNDFTNKDAKDWINDAFSEERSMNTSRDLSKKLDEISRGSQGRLNEIGASRLISVPMSPASESVDDLILNSKDKGYVTQVIGVVPTLARKDSLDASKWKEMNGAMEMEINETTIAEPIKARNQSTREDMTGSGFMLADYTDVQVLARLQEQSLRMSFNSPLNNALSRSLNRSSGALIECVYDEANDPKNATYMSLHKSTGALLDNSRGTPRTKKQAVLSTPRVPQKSGLKQPTRSNCNSLPNSPYNSHRELSQRPITSSSNYDPYQKSLPNLSKQRAMSAMQAHPSDPRLNSNRKSLTLPRQPVPTRTASQPTVNPSSRPVTRPSPSRTTSTQMVSQRLSTATPRGVSAQSSNPRLAGSRQTPTSPSRPARPALSVAPTRVVVRTEVPKSRPTTATSAGRIKPQTPTMSVNKPATRLATTGRPVSGAQPSTISRSTMPSTTSRMAPATTNSRRLPNQTTPPVVTGRTPIKSIPLNSKVPISADTRVGRAPRANTPLAPGVQGRQPQRIPLKPTTTSTPNKQTTSVRTTPMYVQHANEEEDGEDWKDGCY